jgi:hypothetical protein
MSAMPPPPLRHSNTQDETQAQAHAAYIAEVEYLAFRRWHFTALLVVIGIILGLLGSLCVTQHRLAYILTHSIKRIHGDTGHLLTDLDL